LRKGATCQLVATKAGPALPFPEAFPGALCHGWLLPLVGFVAGTEPGSVDCESPNRRLSSAPAGVMAGFGRW